MILKSYSSNGMDAFIQWSFWLSRIDRQVSGVGHKGALSCELCKLLVRNPLNTDLTQIALLHFSIPIKEASKWPLHGSEPPAPRTN